jgi:hypothetical protein
MFRERSEMPAGFPDWFASQPSSSLIGLFVDKH